MVSYSYSDETELEIVFESSADRELCSLSPLSSLELTPNDFLITLSFVSSKSSFY